MLCVVGGEVMGCCKWLGAKVLCLLSQHSLFQYCVTGTESVTLGNGIRYTN